MCRGRALLPLWSGGKREATVTKGGSQPGRHIFRPACMDQQCATDMRGETNAHVVAFLPWGRCRHCDGRIARSCSAPRRDCLRPCVAFRGRLSHQSQPCGIDPRPFRGSDNLPAGVSGVNQATEIRFTTPGTQTSPVELMSPIRKAACGDADDQCSVRNSPDFRPPNHCARFRAAGKGQWRCRLTRHRTDDHVTARGTRCIGVLMLADRRRRCDAGYRTWPPRFRV
jgi:hypothetical protein